MSRHPSAALAGLPGSVVRGAGLHAVFLSLAALLCAPAVSVAEDGSRSGGRSEAYYHFALGHLYHQFAQQFMRQEYVERAVAEYKKALERDPGSIVIRTELINLYAGANRLPEVEELAEEILAEEPGNVEIRRLLGSIYRSYATKRQQEVNKELLQKAVAQFRRVAELEPDNASNFVLLGALYRTADEPRRAEEALRKALELDPSQTDAQVNIAYLLLEAGKIREAIESLEEIVEGGSSDRRHLNALAGAYEQTGRFADAAAILRKLLAQGGNTLETRRRLAESLGRSRQFGQAVDEYKKLLAQDPRNADYFLAISWIERERKNYQRAWEALEGARRLDPDSVQIQFNAIGLLEAEGKLEEAATQIQQLLRATRKAEYALDEKRRRTVLLEQLGALQLQLGDHDAAVKSFRQIGAVDPDFLPQALARVVTALRSAREFERAEEEARKAVAQVGDDFMLANLLAEVLADRGKTKEAVKIAQRQLGNAETDLSVHLAIGRIYQMGRQFEKATASIDRASRLAESDAERVQVLFAYGSMLERARRYEESEEKFRDLLELAPDNAGAMNYLGYMFAERNVNLQEAHDLIQRALDIEPENGAYLDSLGWVYYRQNKLELAAKYLERSLEQYKDDPTVHGHLGDVYYKQGRVEDARRHWQRALLEWNRSAPAERDPDEIESLKRKLAALKLSLAKSASGSKKN